MNRLDIGDDHSLEFREWQGDTMAIVVCHHLRPDGSACMHNAPIKGGAWDREFDGHIESWDLMQRDPLTIAPSLACRACGDHGFIRDGKWVRA
jgi:hypothetical protein